MSETPETDAEYAKSGTWRLRMGNAVPIDFARQLERQRDEAVKIREDEIAEFNAGCDAYKNGVRFEDVEVGPHDQTGIGYAWAAFDDLRKQRDEAVACLRECGRPSEAGLCWCPPRKRNVGHYAYCESARQFLATLDRTEKT
jgi:hypothetical protein